MINIQNIDDNECFKWSLGRYLHAAGLKQARITKTGQGFSKILEFKDINFSTQN